MSILPQELIVTSFTLFKNDSWTPRLKANGKCFVPRGLGSLVLIALSFFACATANAVPRSSSTGARHVSVTDSLVTFDLRDYGAVGDGVTDDGPALQSALDALADVGGGTLFVPDGTYAIITPVAVNFSGRANSINIQGTPSSSPDDGTGNPGRGLNLTAEFLIKTGATMDAITLQNLATLLLENLVIIGDPDTINDAKIVLNLSGIDSATVHYCEFYGLSSLVGGGGIVSAAGTSLEVSDSAFLGCAANSGLYTSIVRVIGRGYPSLVRASLIMATGPASSRKHPFSPPLAGSVSAAPLR
jgi:hypothetical protein